MTSAGQWAPVESFSGLCQFARPMTACREDPGPERVVGMGL
jgi:hypothetical protein